MSSRFKVFASFVFGALIFGATVAHGAACSGVFVGGTGICYPNIPKAHTVLLGEDSGAIGTTSPSTTGFVLTSNGVSADPTFQAVSSGSGTIGTTTPLISGEVDFSTGANTIGNSSNLTFDGTSLNIGANPLIGTGGGDTLTMNGASGYTLLNGNNGWGINLQSDYTRLVGGGIGRVDLQFSTDSGISRFGAGVLSFDSSTYQDGLGGFIAASSSLTRLTATFASSTAISATTICLSTDCRTVWPSGGGSGLSTSSPISDSNLLEYSTKGAGSAYGVATSTLTASSPLTGSFTQIGSGGSLGCQTASGSQAGCLSSADWTTFNGKQATLVGTQGQIAYFSGTNTAVGTSTIFITPQQAVGINTASPTAELDIEGTTTTSAAQALDVWNSAGTNLLRVRDDGNVGIGSSSPAAQLTLGDSVLPTGGYTTGSAGKVFPALLSLVNNSSASNNVYLGAAFSAKSTNTSNGVTGGLFSEAYDTPATSANQLVLIGIEGNAEHFGTGSVLGGIEGLDFNAINSPSSPATSAFTASIVTETENTTVGATSTMMHGIESDIIQNASFTGSTNAAAYYASLSNNNATAQITNAYGLQIGNLVNTGTIASTTGIFIGNLTAGTQTNKPYGIYQLDAAALNYFGGNVGIATSSPISPLTISPSVAPTSAYVTGNGTISLPNVLISTVNTGSSGASTVNSLTADTLVTGSGTTLVGIGGVFSAADPSTRSANLAVLEGLNGGVEHNGTGNISLMDGLLFNSKNNSATTVSTNNAISVSASNAAPGATSTALAGISASIGQSAAFDGTTNANVFDGSITNSAATAQITNAYGLHVENLTNTGTITNTYGVYTGDLSTGTQTNFPYSFYSSDPNTYNYFAGNTGIGTTSPYLPLSVVGNSIFGGTITATSTATSTFYGSMNIGSQSATPLVTIGSTTPTYGYLVNDRLNIVDARNDYVASNVYNLSPNICATADVTEANDLNSTALNFFDMGHTSSGFTGSGCANNPFTGFHANSSYLFDPSGYINFALGSTTGGAFNWFTGGYAAANQKMTLTNAGLLGVGTSTPWRTLSVTGTVGFDGLTSGSGTALCLSTKKELVTCTGGSGTVTSVATDATLTGGTITTTGTLGLNLSNSNTWTALQNINSGIYGTAYKQGLNLTQTNNFLSSSYSPALTLTGDQVTNSCTGTAVPSSWSISNKTFPTAIVNGLYSNLVFDSVLTACGGTVSTTTALSITNTATGLLVGIGTSTPFANLSVSDTPSTFSLSAFAIGSSTAAFATSTLFAIDNTGHVVTGSPKGSLSSCGTTNSLNGNDNSGTIMLTGTLVTACTLTFANPTPANQNLSCTSSDVSTAIFSNVTATTTTSVTFGLSGTVSSATIFYHCDRNVND